MPLIGQWTFEDPAAPGADTSGYANPAAFSGGAYQTGTGSTELDGINDFAEIANAKQYVITNGTVHGSFTADAGSMDGTQSTSVNDPSLQALVSRDSSGFDGGGHLTIYLDGDGSLYVRHQSDTQDYEIRTDPGLVSEGQAFDLVYSFSEIDGMVLWVDGVEVGTNTDAVTNNDSLALSGNAEPWVLGASQVLSGDGVANNLQQFFDGEIGHFEIYDEPLDPTELNTLHDLSDGIDDGSIVGTAGDDLIYGGPGEGAEDGGAVIDDTINAGDGNDVVHAGDGADIVNGEGGDDTLYGGDGDDQINGGAGNDYIEGGAGNDTIQGGEGNDTLDGGEGDDVVLGGTEDDTITGGAGNDVLYGNDGTDVIQGGAGADTIYVGAGSDTVDAGDDADSITFIDGFGTDVVAGGEGGSDTDLIDLQYLTTGVAVTFSGDEAGTLSTGPDTATFTEIEHIQLTGQDDTLDGSLSTAYMGVAGGGGNDQITGGSAADILLGGAGSDTIDGGAGTDDIQGGDGDDEIAGGAGADTMHGDAGDDTFTIEDGFGNDDIFGGEAGETDGDTIDLSAVTLPLTVVYTGDETGTITDGIQGILFSETENLILTAGDDYVEARMDTAGLDITAGAGDDVIYSGDATNTLDGGDGSDTFHIGRGNDTIIGGEGGSDVDTLSGAAANDALTVTFTGDEAGTYFDADGDSGSFTEVEAFELTAGNDVLDGSASTASITVDAGAGADDITGGSGDDTLTGGAGDDVFVLADGFGADVITDFDTGDSDGDGFFNDQFDVTNLTDSNGDPVNAWDVSVTDDGSGNALLTFPNGETVLLEGVAPSEVNTPQMMVAAGLPCYAAGTMIDTPEGPRVVESLRAGNLVNTVDHGPQAIRWTRRDAQTLMEVERDQTPVLIMAGALGRNLPAGDLIVSPQHRILVGGAGQLQQIFPSEVFAPAKSLTSVPGIRHMQGKAEITWVHFACARHEVVMANGCLSESLLLGPMVVQGMQGSQCRDLTRIFGSAATPDAALNGPPARECLTVGTARRQIARHRIAAGCLIDRETGKRDGGPALEEGKAGDDAEFCASGRYHSDALGAFYEQNGDRAFRLDPFARRPFALLGSGAETKM